MSETRAQKDRADALPEGLGALGEPDLTLDEAEGAELYWLLNPDEERRPFNDEEVAEIAAESWTNESTVYGLVETVAAKQNEIDDLLAWRRRVEHEIGRVPDAAWLGRLKEAAGL